MIILLDLDVVLDFALDRKPFAEASAQLLDILQAKPGTAFIAWHSIANSYYIVTPKRSRNNAKDFLAGLTGFVEVAPVNTESFRYAAKLPMRDFEDAMQVAAAAACDAEVIATRNLRDYRNSPIRSAPPRDLVGELN